MPRIPIGNFGNAIAQPAPAVRIPQGAFDGGSGAQKLGDTAMRLAGSMIDEQHKTDEKVALITAHAKVQTGIADMSDATARGVADGTISRDQAEPLFAAESQKLVLEHTKDLPPDMQKVIKAEAISISGRYANGIRDVVTKRGQQDTAAGLLSYLEGMTRLAATDREKATNQAMMTIDSIGPAAGFDPVKLHNLKQQTKEGIAYNSALRMVSGSRDSIKGIDQALKALDGPEYADMDPKRSEIMRSSLTANRSRLENKIEGHLARLETRAERTIGHIDAQIASGVPATPEMWSGWESSVRGTSHEAAFAERVKDEVTTQRLLSEPFDVQTDYIQKREATLNQYGGNLRDKQNLDRLKRVVETGKKQLDEAPLIFAHNRTGEAVKPLDLSMLLDSSRMSEISGIFNDRAATLNGLKRKYGDTVRMRVLLPLEAEMLTKTLDKSSPDQSIEIFRMLRTTIGDEKAYQGALSQVAADSPVKALAGVLAAHGHDYTQTHVFSPDETIVARQTARLALVGESLLNPTRSQKGSDGRTNTWTMPKKADMLRRFNDKVGDTFADTPHAMDAQYEFVQATYAGMMASRGATKNPEILDAAVFDQALERTTPMMKQGGASFLKPFVGMSDGQFLEKLRDAVPEEFKAHVDRLPLRNVRSNQYVILNGARPVLKDGSPLIITVAP